MTQTKFDNEQLPDELMISPDQDTSHVLGRAVIFTTASNDDAGFAHYDHATTSGYAFRQASSGLIIFNAPAAQGFNFAIAGSSKHKILGSNFFFGINDTSPSYMLEVNGDANVTGVFTAGTKTFRIDHPLLPLDKILYHAVVESPEHGLMYRGKSKLIDGKVTINIDEFWGMTPGTFAALTQNVIVQSLQNQDGFDRVKPGIITADSFEIICENPASTDEIAWMITAARHDALVKHSDLNDEEGNLIIEVDKEEPTTEELEVLNDEIIYNSDIEETKEEKVDSLKNKKGYYIHPESHGTTRPYKNIIKTKEKE